MNTNILKSFYSRKFLAGIAVFGAMIAGFVAIRAYADTTATITGNIQNGSNVNLTSAQIGTLVHDSVNVASSTGPVPTGTVDFNKYPNSTCSGTATVQAGVALVNGIAQSATTTLANTGLSYIVHYNGQTDVYPASNGACQVLTATASSTTLTTTLSTTTPIYVGSSVHDSATLGNATSNAGGSVAYTVYSNNSCTANPVGDGTGAVTNGVVSNSSDLEFNTPGTYYFQAVYSGDAHNAVATSSCGSEVLTVLATSTPAGHIVVDKVTNPASDTTSFHFNVTGSGYSAFDLTGAATPNNQTLSPGTYTISESSVSGWTATSTCSVNSGSAVAYTPGSNITLGNGDTVTCTFTNTKIATTTNPGTAMVSGTVFNDLNKNGVKDGNETQGLPGFTINLYSGTGWSGPTNKAPLQTSVSDASGNYSFSNLANGTYSIEEVNKAGWTQTNSDYNSVVITNGASITHEDFGNASSTNNGNGKGKDKFFNRFKNFLKKFQKFENGHDNGLHLGQIKNGNKGHGNDKDED